MDVYDAVRTTLAVRRYQETPIPDDLVRRIVEAGRLTGSSMNLQPWHFVVVDERETLRELGGLLSSGRYTADAPLAIVIVVERTRFAVSDASRAIQSMVLTAWSEGVGSNWVGFGGMDAVGQLLGVPDDHEVFAVLPFGYPSDPIGKGDKERKPLSEVASRGRFGQPFS